MTAANCAVTDLAVMFDLLKARRGCRAAVALIAPLVEQSRRKFADIPATTWSDPYVIGFLAMLITISANRAVGGLNSQSIGIVQHDAWREIVGCGPVAIGEEICLLSAAKDHLFIDGCRKASSLMDRADADGVMTGATDLSTTGYERSGDRKAGMIGELWVEYFDEYISQSLS